MAVLASQIASSRISARITLCTRTVSFFPFVDVSLAISFNHHYTPLARTPLILSRSHAKNRMAHDTPRRNVRSNITHDVSRQTKAVQTRLRDWTRYVRFDLPAASLARLPPVHSAAQCRASFPHALQCHSVRVVPQAAPPTPHRRTNSDAPHYLAATCWSWLRDERPRGGPVSDLAEETYYFLHWTKLADASLWFFRRSRRCDRDKLRDKFRLAVVNERQLWWENSVNIVFISNEIKLTSGNWRNTNFNSTFLITRQNVSRPYLYDGWFIATR